MTDEKTDYKKLREQEQQLDERFYEIQAEIKKLADSGLRNLAEIRQEVKRRQNWQQTDFLNFVEPQPAIFNLVEPQPANPPYKPSWLVRRWLDNYDAMD